MKILILANMNQRLRDQILLCQSLQKLDRKLNFYFLLFDDLLEKELAASNFSYSIFKKTPRGKGSNSNNIISKFKACLPDRLKKILLVFREGTFFELFRYRKQLKFLQGEYDWCKPFFESFNPNIVMVNGDRHLRLEPAVLKLSKEYGIKSIVPYFTYSFDLGPLKSCRGRSLLEKTLKSPILTHFAHYKFRRRCINFAGKPYLFYPPSQMLALHKFGTLSDYPWYIGNGLVDVVCIDSKHSFHRYSKNKVPNNKLRVVGDIAYDSLYHSFSNRETNREEIQTKYSLNPDKKLIVCALPQLAEHGFCSWENHWKEIEFLVDSLASQNESLLLSLHPKMAVQKYKYLEDKFDCKIVEERLFKILPCADLFVATFSSTVIWAVLCGINSVVVDFYDLNYSMYDFLSSVVKVNEKGQLVKALESALKKKGSFKDDWRSLSRDLVFDGKVCYRFLNIAQNING